MAAIVGPNGAGKSTFIKAALALTPRLTGDVTFFGESLRAVRQRIAYAPQRAAIDWDFPITVEEVVLMGVYGQRGWVRRPRKEDYLRVADALEVVGLASFRQRPIAQLSGGQQQRTFLARALVQQADLWILDEPFQGSTPRQSMHSSQCYTGSKPRARRLLRFTTIYKRCRNTLIICLPSTFDALPRGICAT